MCNRYNYFCVIDKSFGGYFLHISYITIAFIPSLKTNYYGLR
jgi:hypothetical protein